MKLKIFIQQKTFKIKQLSLFDYDTQQNEISLPLFHNCKKYYTLVEYENIETLKVIMSNFLQICAGNNDVCLISKEVS